MKFVLVFVIVSFNLGLYAQDTLTGSSDSIDLSTTFKVPVIFHVVYNKKRSNLSEKRIKEFLETLQQDCLGENADLSDVPEDFKELIGNLNVEFYLADTLPNGTKTSGIIRKKSLTPRFNVKMRGIFKKSAIVDPDKYLNIYICDLFKSNGFTPMNAQRQNNGVVVDYTLVHKGSRTGTHEIGHWLGLYHTFKGGCEDTDGIDDTPAMTKAKFRDCPEHPHTTCEEPEMFMNFMNYSECRIFFSKDQVEFMREYIKTNKQFQR